MISIEQGFKGRFCSYYSTNPARKLLHVVLHITEGAFPSDVEYLLHNEDRPVSCHFYVDPDAKAYQTLSLDRIAWTQGVADADRTDRPDLWKVWEKDENMNSVSIEVSSKYGKPMTEAQMKTTAAIVAKLLIENPGIKFDRTNIVGHYELNKNKQDPPKFDFVRFFAEVIYQKGLATQAPVVPATTRFFTQTGKTISGPFKELYELSGDVERLGYPITDAVQDDVDPELTVQYTENNRMEWHPTRSGYPRFGAVGRLYLKAKAELASKKG